MEWIRKIRSCRKDQAVILLLLGLLLLVIAVPSGETGDRESLLPARTDETEAAAAELSTEEKLEQRLSAILSRVQGIGKTQVMITLKSDGKKIVEKDLEQSQEREESSQDTSASAASSENSRESTVYERNSQGGEIPYVTESVSPEIQGVLVIAEGADNAAAVSEITEAVMALFHVEAHKIKVMKME